MRVRDNMDSRMSTTLDINYNLKVNYNHHDDVEILRVSTHSRPSAVAGAIAGVIRSQGRVDVQAIGAGAINQAIKSIAIARDYLHPNGLDIVVIPTFIDVKIEREERTAIRLIIEARPI